MRRLCPAFAGTAALALALRSRRAASDERGARTARADSESDADPASLEAELTWWDTSDPTNEGPTVPGPDQEVQRGIPGLKINYESVPFGRRAEQVQDRRRRRAPARPTSCAPRSPGSPSSPRRATSTPSTAPPLLEDNNFLETPLSSNVYDGKTYGVPQVTDTLGLMYNKAALREGRHHRAPHHLGRGRRRRQPLKSKAGVDGLYINNGGYFLLPFIYGEGGDLVDAEPRRSRSTRPRPSPASRPPRTSSTAGPPSSRTPTTPTAR